MDHRPLLMRGDPTEDRRGLELVGQQLLIVGDLASVDPGIGPVDAGPTGDLGDRGRVVAGDHLELDALLLEEGEDLGSIGTHGVLEQHQAHRRAARRQLLVMPAVVGAGDEQDAQAGGGRLGGPGLLGVVIVVEEDVGGAEVIGAAIAELGGGPLASRRERQVAGDLPPLGGGVVGDDRLERGVGRRVRRAERAEHLGGIGIGGAADRLDRRQADLTRGDRAGLVEAQGVDPGEQLDRGQLLRQRLAAGEGDHPGDEAEAREQHEAVGHHGDRCGNGGLERILPDDRVVTELAEQQQHRRRRDDEREPAQDDVDPARSSLPAISNRRASSESLAA